MCRLSAKKKPKHTKLEIELARIQVARMKWKWTRYTNELNLAISNYLFLVRDSLDEGIYHHLE